MLAAYLVCLIVGGVFVAMSVMSGLEQDGGGDGLGHDHDVSPEGDFDVDGDVDVDADIDADADFDADHELGHGLGHDTHLGEAALAGHAGSEDDDKTARKPRRKQRLWLPFLSFRFWTFGSAFFGLTGTILTALALTGQLETFFIALGMGTVTGAATAALVRSLRSPVGLGVNKRDLVGHVGELLYDIAPGRTSKVALKAPRIGSIELLAVTGFPRPLPAGTRVVVLGIEADGRALVGPEAEVFEGEDSLVEHIAERGEEEEA